MKRWILAAAVAVALPLAAASPEACSVEADLHPFMGVLEPAPGNIAPPAGMTGFSHDSLDAELARERRAAMVIRPDTLRRHLRLLTEDAHVAGTPADRATAEYVRDRLAQKLSGPPTLTEVLQPAEEVMGTCGDERVHDEHPPGRAHRPTLRAPHRRVRVRQGIVKIPGRGLTALPDRAGARASFGREPRHTRDTPHHRHHRHVRRGGGLRAVAGPR